MPINSLFKPSERVLCCARKIANTARSPWTVLVFYLVFLVDSFLFFVPADALIACSVLLVPERKRVWFLAALAGSLTGFLIFYFLTLSSFQGAVIDFIVRHDYGANYQEIITHAAKYGYFNLSVAVFTFVPPCIALVTALLIGLNPYLVFLIICFAKFVRIALMIFAVKKFWGGVTYIKHTVFKRP